MLDFSTHSLILVFLCIGWTCPESDSLMPNLFRVGIQGGPGSFNDSALRQYIVQNPELEFQVRFLNSTGEVFEALKEGQVEYGQFALFNSNAGFYEESLAEVSRRKFTVEASYSCPIVHCLMKRQGTSTDAISTIMSHREVFKQCRAKLKLKYPRAQLIEGTGALADPSRVGEALAQGALPATTAVVSNGLIAELHDLEVVETGLQDAGDNVSTFLLISDFKS